MVTSNILTPEQSPVKFAISMNGKFHPVDTATDTVDTNKKLAGPVDFNLYKRYGRTSAFIFYSMKKKYLKTLNVE